MPFRTSVTVVLLAALVHPIGAVAAQESVCSGGPAGPPPGRDTVALDQLLDSAAFLAELERMWRPEWGNTVARVAFDSVGALDEIGSTTLPAGEKWGSQRAPHNGVPLLIDGLLRVRSWPSGPFTSRIWVGDGDGAAPRSVSRFRSCRPRVRNRGRILRLISERSRVVTNEVRGGLSTALDLFVSEDGMPIETRLAHSSGHSGWDLIALGIGPEFRFDPASSEGVATAVWVRVPVAFTSLTPPRSPSPGPPS